MSLLVALVAAVALVLSIPSREYMTDKDVMKEAEVEANRESPPPPSMAAIVNAMPTTPGPVVDPKKPKVPAPSGAKDAVQSISSEKTEGFATESFAPF
jgi:hypothetical protein